MINIFSYSGHSTHELDTAEVRNYNFDLRLLGSKSSILVLPAA